MSSSAPAFATLALVQTERLLTIVLNRPKRFNAFTPQMYDELVAALRWADGASTVAVVLLTANGTYYSSGNDLSNFMNMSASGKSPLEASQEAAVLLKRFVAAFIDFSKPLIAAVNGPCLGIAMTTLGLCDVVYCSPTAWFQTPFSQLGQSPEGCSSHVFPKLMGVGAANEVLMFGRKLNAAEALERRLVTAVFGPNSSSDESTAAFRREATARAQTLAALPPTSLFVCKRLTRDVERQTLHAVNAAECETLIERWSSADCAEAVAKFMYDQAAKQREKKKQAKAPATATSVVASDAAPAAATAAAAASNSGSGSGSFQSAAAFAEIGKRMAADGAAMVKKVGCIYRFDLTAADGAQGSWLIDLKTGGGAVRACSNADKADCMIAMKDGDFLQLIAGKLNAQQAFMKGQLKIKGNMMLAQKLSVLTQAQAKL